MASPPTGQGPGVARPHLVHLVLASKKALQHGEQLCSRARTLSVESAQTAVDVLALDAKVRWITSAVNEQLKLATGVAKVIERKRSELERQAKNWDTVRTQRSAALDSVLDSLGGEVVPPEFYSSSPVPSLFGSQHGSDDDSEPQPANSSIGGFLPGQSPTETLRGVLRNGMSNSRTPSTRNKDRSEWKTLRDFVDEQAIEDVLDSIESDRNVLDDMLAKTSDYPETLMTTISVIQNSLPPSISIPPMTDIFSAQELASDEMAHHLSSLLGHYDQMVQAVHDSEAGVEFSDADVQDMNRDTDELPAIISDLEKNISAIGLSHEQLLVAKRKSQEHLEVHRNILNDLDELGDIISEMLGRQETIEIESGEQLNHLEQRLSTIEDLHQRYTSYQYSYCKLVIELARRKKYADAARKLVQDMTIQLQTMVEKEQHRRQEFNGTHGEYLPVDVCLAMTYAPTRWQVLPEGSQSSEILPDIDADILADAMKRVSAAEGAISASQSL